MYKMHTHENSGVNQKIFITVVLCRDLSYWSSGQTSSSAFLVVLGRRSPMRPPPMSRVATAKIGTAQVVSTK